jgi:hypothetical protein
VDHPGTAGAMAAELGALAVVRGVELVGSFQASTASA